MEVYALNVFILDVPHSINQHVHAPAVQMVTNTPTINVFPVVICIVIVVSLIKQFVRHVLLDMDYHLRLV